MTMQKILIREMRKVQQKRYIFYAFAYPNEIYEVRSRLKDANINYRTEPVIKNNAVIGYKVFTRC